MNIRTASRNDADAISRVCESAFPESESGLVATLAVNLLSEITDPRILSLVCEADDLIAGHVAFSPVWERETMEPLGYILAPLAVLPDHQRGGIGSGLVKYGIKCLSECGVGFLLVYGDPNYYGRFGFTVDGAESYLPPYPLRYPHGWLGLMLGDGDARRSAVRISCVASLYDPDLW